MIEFVLQEPFVPEGVLLRASVSVYEAPFAVKHLERVAQLFFEAEQRIEQKQFDLEQADAGKR